MKRLLRGELYRLTRSRALLLALFVILAADLFLSSRCRVTTENMYDLPELCTMNQFMNFADSSNMSVRTAKSFFQKRGQLEESDAEDLMEVFRDVHPSQFRWLLANRQGMLVIPVVFAMVFLARDFGSRSLNHALYAGRSRRQLYAAKLIFLFASAFLISLVGICVLTVRYAGSVYTRLPAGYVWPRLALHALSDAALIAPALLAVWLLRKPVLSGAVIVVYDAVVRFVPIPILTRREPDVWARGGNLLPLLAASAILLVLCAVSGWLSFRRAELD